MTTAETILSEVCNRYGVQFRTVSDACGSYLHARLESGQWLCAYDAEDYAVTLSDRLQIELERARVGEIHSGLGWALVVFDNCTACGDDHPASCSEDDIVSRSDSDLWAEELPEIVGEILATMVGAR